MSIKQDRAIKAWEPGVCDFSVYEVKTKAKMASHAGCLEVLEGELRDMNGKVIATGGKYAGLKFDPSKGYDEDANETDKKVNLQKQLNAASMSIYTYLLGTLAEGPTQYLLTKKIPFGDGRLVWENLLAKYGSENSEDAYPLSVTLRRLKLSKSKSTEDYMYKFDDTYNRMVRALLSDSRDYKRAT